MREDIILNCDLNMMSFFSVGTLEAHENYGELIFQDLTPSSFISDSNFLGECPEFSCRLYR